MTLIRVGSAWSKVGKASGAGYFSISMEPQLLQKVVPAPKGIRLMMFKVKTKKSENSPDYTIMGDDGTEKQANNF